MGLRSSGAAGSRRLDGKKYEKPSLKNKNYLTHLNIDVYTLTLSTTLAHFAL